MLLFLAACSPHHAPAQGAGAPPESSPVGESARTTGAGTSVAVGQVLVLDETGLQLLLSNPGDTLLVVNFWATWCGPCVREMTTIRAVAMAYPSVRFALVSVDDPAGLPLVGPFLRSHDILLPTYQLSVGDTSAVLARNVAGWPDIIPVTLVLEPGGQVRTRFDGSVEPEALRAALQ